MNAPFYNRIKSLSRLKTRFFVPGHKGSRSETAWLGGAARLDLTEIDGADDLQNPTDTIKQSQDKITGLYGTGQSLFSAAGSTSCIQAMLTLFLKPGDTVIMNRSCHISAVRAAAVLNLNVKWLWQTEFNEIDFKALENEIAESKAAAVYLTSPNYYGFTADIKTAAMLCDKYKIPLLVDNAHGAYLKFVTPDIHPITLGASAAAESMHKTLPCLTGAAVLHIKDKSLAGRARWALNLYSSTSPSYLVMCSMDIAAEMLRKNKLNFNFCAEMCQAVRKKLYPLAISAKNTEPCKITLRPKNIGMNTETVLNVLKKNKIFPEMSDKNYIVLMASASNKRSDFKRLERALLPVLKSAASIESNGETEKPLCGVQTQKPQKACGIREAFFAVKEEIDTKTAEGRTAAGIITPCPPGVPLIMPGEILRRQDCECIIKSGIFKIDVVK